MTKIVDVIAPSGSFPVDVLNQISAFLRAHQCEARIPSNILGNDLLCANTEKERFALLKQALYAEDSDLIWAVRGGYGATPLLTYLQDLPIPKKKKTLVGFSDITALHLFLTQQWGWQTIHGASLRQLVESNALEAESQTFNMQILQGSMQVKHMLTALNAAAETAHLSGALTGGNLKLVEASLGTFWQIDATDKILLLEEVSEWDYRVARSLVHLEQSGAFNKVDAVVFGTFTYEQHPAQEENIQKVLTAFAQKQKFPVFNGPFFGHGQVNCPWRYAEAKIENGVLTQ